MLAPGSIHPETGRLYRADPLADFSVIPDEPEKLLGMLGVQDIVWPAEAGRHVPEELETMLSGLEVQHYADRAQWLEMMMSCHFATSGAGREEFIAWSVGDPDFAYDEELIRRRWNSLRLNKNRPITEKTLYKALHAAGKGDLIPRATPAEDFAGLEGEPFEPPAKVEKRERVLNRAHRATDDMRNALRACARSSIQPAYDELKQAVVFLGYLPWNDGYGRTLDDHTLRLLRLHLIEANAGFDYQPSKENVLEAVTTLAYNDRFNTGAVGQVSTTSD